MSRLACTSYNSIQRASPQLKLFELFDINSPDDFSTCLAGLPHLRELRLHESDISDSIIQQFHGPEGFCPLLERIDLRWCGQVTGRALFDLVENRLHSTHSGGRSNMLPVVNTITALTVINCPFVKEQEVLGLAQAIVCRVVMGSSDYCHTLGCCQNERYRKRLQLCGIRRTNTVRGRGKLVL